MKFFAALPRRSGPRARSPGEGLFSTASCCVYYLNKCNYTVYIHDRYGKLLTVLTPNRPNWDGEYHGRKMPSSDYWYRVDYTVGGKNLSFKSHFVLKR